MLIMRYVPKHQKGHKILLYTLGVSIKHILWAINIIKHRLVDDSSRLGYGEISSQPAIMYADNLLHKKQRLKLFYNLTYLFIEYQNEWTDAVSAKNLTLCCLFLFFCWYSKNLLLQYFIIKELFVLKIMTVPSRNKVKSANGRMARVFPC